MKLNPHNIAITATKATAQKLKTLGGIWNAKQQAFLFPKSTHALDEIADHIPEIAHTTAFQIISAQLHDARRELAFKKATSDPNKPTTTNDKLRPYQRQDVNYLVNIPNAAILNQPRTGKSPTLIELVKQKQTTKNAIITPASLTQNWLRELKTWHPEAHAIIYQGTPKQKEKAISAHQSATKAQPPTPSYLIISKDTAKRDLQILAQLEFDTLTVDEAHFLRNETLQTKAIHSLGKLAKHRYALTGTPTVKHPSDIYGILHFLYPDKWKSRWQFYERYFHINQGFFGKEIGPPKHNRVAELKDFVDAISTQRLRKDVMPWLPNKNKQEHIVQMKPQQAKLYKQMQEDFIAQLEENGTEIDAQNVLAQFIRLRQIALDPRLIGFDAPSAKTEALLEAIENGTYADANAGSDPIVIMSTFTSYLKLLKPMIEKLGKRTAMITGEQTTTDKQKAAEAFQKGQVDVLLCNTISAGTGFTLDRGEVIIFLDKPWNPSDLEQAEDRITPTQQNRSHKIDIISLITDQTIERAIENVLNNKNDLTKILNNMKSVDEYKRFIV